MSAPVKKTRCRNCHGDPNVVAYWQTWDGAWLENIERVWVSDGKGAGSWQYEYEYGAGASNAGDAGEDQEFHCRSCGHYRPSLDELLEEVIIWHDCEIPLSGKHASAGTPEA